MDPPAPVFERSDSLQNSKGGVALARAVVKSYCSVRQQDEKFLSSSWDSMRKEPTVVQATVVRAERRNQAAVSSYISTKQHDEKSRSEWDSLQSDPRDLVPPLVQTLIVEPLHEMTSAKVALPSALKKPTFTKANARYKSEDTTSTYPESRNGYSDAEDGDDSKNLPMFEEEQTERSNLAAKSSARVSAVSFGNVEVREHFLNEERSVIDTVEGYEAKRRFAKQLPRYIPKDAPTTKSLTYETIRVQGTTTTPKPTQVAHHESPPPPLSQEFLYSGFEEKFQSKRSKKKGFFRGLFKRKSAKKLAYI